MNRPKYTFLLPAYKANDLEEMLKSLQCQTFKDFTVLVSDDNSPEPVKTIFDKFSDDSRFVYRRNSENIGAYNLVDHWNLLLNHADSEYIILACDDDIYSPFFLSEIDKLTLKYSHVDVLRARANRIDKNGRVYQKDAVYEEYCSHLEFLADRYDEKDIWCIGNYVFKRTPLLNSGGFVKFPLAWCSDGASAIKASVNGAANTSAILFSIRWSGMSISSFHTTGKLEIRNQKSKLKSILLYSDWISDFTKGSITAEDQLSINIKSFFDRRFRFKIFMGVLPFVGYLSFKEKIQLYAFLKKRNFFDTKYFQYLYIKEWLKTVIT